MTQLKGYMGKVLFIDLSARSFKEFPWTDADRKRTLGGKIMAADILLHHITPEMQAFDEDNWLVITTGPLTGTGCPNTSRFNISTISPLTNILTSSNCGGDFGLTLKRAGYDAAIITGKSETPVHVHITQDNVEFLDASALWGMKTGEAQEHLKQYPGRLVIGPAGEHKVLYASVFSNERTAGRGGVGAVFGSKNLKAVTAFGTKLPKIYDEKSLRELNVKWIKTLQNHPLTGRQLPKLGTAGLIAPMQAHSILATKNFSAGRYGAFEKISGEELAENHLVSNGACTTCVIRCARMCKVDDKIVKGPELETLGLLGPNILNDDIELILKWNYELDELGMDAISCAGSVAFAMELAEKGVHDFGIRFGKTDNLSQMFEDIAYRRGEGDFIADGSKRMSERFGGKEYAIHAKGMELAAYEPRHAVGHGLGYATANRGGCHLNAGYLVVLEGLGLDIDSLTHHGKAALAIMLQQLFVYQLCGLPGLFGGSAQLDAHQDHSCRVPIRRSDRESALALHKGCADSAAAAAAHQSGASCHRHAHHDGVHADLGRLRLQRGTHFQCHSRTKSRRRHAAQAPDRRAAGSEQSAHQGAAGQNAQGLLPRTRLEARDSDLSPAENAGNHP